MRSSINIFTGAILAVSGLVTAISPLIFIVIIPLVFIPIYQSLPSEAGSMFGTLFIVIGAVVLLSLLGVVAIGLIMTVGGGALIYFGVRNLKKGGVEKQRLELEGVNAPGEVTYVDRNYSVLFNNQPIYSIVEYKFRDYMGREFIGRKEDISSETVIRQKIEVGSQVMVRYIPASPSQNTLLLTGTKN